MNTHQIFSVMLFVCVYLFLDIAGSKSFGTFLYGQPSDKLKKVRSHHQFRRPPPWPSQPNYDAFEKTTKLSKLHTAISLLFSHLCFWFQSYLCFDAMTKKTAFKHNITKEKDTFCSYNVSCSSPKSSKTTVIKTFGKKSNSLPYSRLLKGVVSLPTNLKSSLLLLFITINLLSTSDLSSSTDGRKSIFVASAISNSARIGGKNNLPTLRCYICGGQTGLPCEDIRSAGRRSPYVRPKPQTTLDGRKMFENCTDLINNKGCIKQVINGGELDKKTDIFTYDYMKRPQISAYIYK